MTVTARRAFSADREGNHFGFKLFPQAAGPRKTGLAELSPVGVDQGRSDGRVTGPVRDLGEEGEIVFRAPVEMDAVVTSVGDAGCSGLGDDELQMTGVGGVERAGLDDPGLDPGAITLDHFPGEKWHLRLHLDRMILKGAVLDQLGVKAAVSAVVDVLKKQPVKDRA